MTESSKGHFNSEELIYIPQYSKNYTKAWPINATWVTAQNCVWKGAKYAKLKNHSAISHHYGRHEKLFLEVVRVQFTIEISDILSEIELNAASYGPNDLYGILQELSEFIKENSDARGQRSRRSGSGFRSVLSRHPIFPISQPGSTSITNHTCAPTSQWFIPDHQSFHSLFSEKIPLMVFDSMALSNISHLLQYLDCNWRRLSSQARAYPENPEKVRYARNYSARLQGKAKYIQSLVPDSLPYRRPSLVAVEIAVHRVDSDTVTVQWEVEWDSSTYKSSVYESQVVVMLHGKTLTIYMPAKYIHQQARPPLDLAPDLVAFLGIPPERSALVEQILTRVWDSDTTEIETALTRKGFRFDFFREDEVREEKSSERPPVIETEENSQAPSDELVVVKSEPHLIEEETGVPITETKLYMTDQQVTSIDLVKDVKSEKDGKDLINNIATPSDFSVTSSLTELPARTTAYEIPLTDPENMLEDFQLVLDEDNKDFQKLPEMVDKVLGDGESNLLQVSSSIRVKGESSRVQQGAEEVHYRIEASTPLISEEKLYYRPHLSSPTPSDNDDPDDSDYSTDDSDPPLPGAQLGSKRNEAKMSDKNQNRSKDELLTSSSNKEDQSRIQATPKPTTTSSKHSHIPPPKDISLRQLQQFISPLRNTTQNKRVDEQYNVTRRLQKTGLFRLSGPTSIIYVSNPDDLPPMESKNNDTQVLATLQARMQIFKDDNRSVFALIPTIANDEDTELAFLGQAWVSQMLFNYLGSVYKPQRDWRSPMRAGLGYDELEAPISNSETPFIIEKDTGALSQFLFQQGYEPAGRWMRSLPGVRTYYIDVQTTPESRTRPFTITPSRMEKMRECRISRNSEVPEKVYILIRLSSVYSRHPGVVPTASFYVDPWDFYTEGYMHVKLNNELFSMRISIEARPHFTMKSPEREVHDSDDSTSSSDIIDRVVRLFSSNRSQEPTRPPNVSQSQRSYKYMSLRRADKIRLLALRPGKGAAPLWGELEVHRLPENSSPPDYVCISYVWGSSLKQFSLYTPEGILMLTASLYLALLHLRDVNKTIYLWADAICIDQEDSPGQRNEEKEHQILMLPRIFRYAKTVFAWLGIEENGSRKVMRKFEDWGTKITQGKHEELKDKIEVTDPIWVSISRLLNRRWFTRMWIVQEVVLARKLIIVCGKHRLSWDIFYAAAKHCLIRNKYDPKIDIATLDTAKNIIDLGKLRNSFQKREDFRSKQTVFTLLNQCYQKDATVPRDRIFALLSMATDKDEVGFRPNYQASNLEIIQQFASTFVKQGYALELLYRTRPETRLIEEQGMRSKTEVMLPSWVPNLTANQYPSSLSTWSRNHLAGIRKDEGSNHGGKAELKNLAKVDGKALILRGYVACKVNNKGKNHSMLDDVMAYLGEIFSTIDKLYDGKKTAREIEEIKWKTAIGDATSLANEVDDNKRGDDDGNEASTRIPHTPEKVKKIQQHKQHKQERFEAQAISAYGALVGYLASERPHSNWKKQKSRFEYAMKGQKVFDANRDAWQRLLPYVYKAIAFAEVFAPQRVVVCDTDKRDVGIVPAVAEKGDVVALFPGAKVPFILREKSAGEYELIGECYIHGIMRGEGLPATNEDEKVFRLV
ncbi:hypothetical protein F4818DRAFT_74872 [Hypoxylon cercidicola]|nr:hypothetical protein F4818DRAFT_74872 [Hypoxylon cercidicola]